MSRQTVQHVAVVGAGMVGLATAWHLQEHGIGVTVLDREGVAAGSSWGNAGYVSPAFVTPLPEPAVLRYGLRAVLSRRSPVYVPLRPDANLLKFLAGFTRNSTAARFRRGLRALTPLGQRAVGCFEELVGNGVDATVHEAAPVLAVYREPSETEPLLHELAEVRAAGVDVKYEPLSGAEARAITPLLSDAAGAAVAVYGQRFIDPGAFVEALARSVEQRGGTIRNGIDVQRVEDAGSSARVVARSAEPEDFDAVVLASGAEVGTLARPFGVRTVVQAGRGYSFSVPASPEPEMPMYFPRQRVACTPYRGRLRIGGMMEFRRAGDPLDPRRVRAIAEAVRPLLDNVDLDDRADEWVGARPCTPDGLPLAGPTASPRVYIAAGHGMWGVALGPVTGKLVAEAVATGRVPAELRPLDPQR